jgi:hypothetical protein
MTAGLPAMGLSGLFMLLTALLVPLVQFARPRALRGDRRAIRLFLLAAASVLTAAAVWVLLRLVAPSVPRLFPESAWHVGSLVAPAIVISLLILASVLVVPEGLLRTIGTRPTPPLPPVRAVDVHTSDRQQGPEHAGVESA